MNKKIISGIASLALIGISTGASAVTVDFVNGNWDHTCGGGGMSVGWDNTYTCGAVSDATLTVTLNMSFFGTASGHSSNAEYLSQAAFEGFLMGNDSGSDDENNGPALENYQQWLFEFSQAVPVNGLVVNDIDFGQWRDAVGLEAFSGGFAGAGNNQDMNIILNGTTALEIVDDFGLQYVNSTNAVNSNQTAPTAPDYALTANSTGDVDGFAVYLFNTGASVNEHGVAIIGAFDAGPPTTEIPAPGALLLMSAGLLGFRMLRRS